MTRGLLLMTALLGLLCGAASVAAATPARIVAESVDRYTIRDGPLAGEWIRVSVIVTRKRALALSADNVHLDYPDKSPERTWIAAVFDAPRDALRVAGGMLLPEGAPGQGHATPMVYPLMRTFGYRSLPRRHAFLNQPDGQLLITADDVGVARKNDGSATGSVTLWLSFPVDTGRDSEPNQVGVDGVSIELAGVPRRMPSPPRGRFARDADEDETPRTSWVTAMEEPAPARAPEAALPRPLADAVEAAPSKGPVVRSDRAASEPQRPVAALRKPAATPSPAPLDAPSAVTDVPERIEAHPAKAHAEAAALREMQREQLAALQYESNALAAHKNVILANQARLRAELERGGQSLDSRTRAAYEAQLAELRALASAVTRESARIGAQEDALRAALDRQSGAGESPAIRSDAPVLQRWTASASTAIRRAWRVPAGAAPGLATQLALRVDHQGYVEAVRIESSSGNRAFDQSASLAALQASPLPPPPATADGSRVLSVRLEAPQRDAAASESAATEAVQQRAVAALRAAAPKDTEIQRPIENGPDMARLQRALAKLGFDPGTPDGLFGKKTREGIRDFERSRGQRPVGKPTRAVLRAVEQAAARR